MKVYLDDFLNTLTTQAIASSRKRQHHNIHETYEDPAQRLFNAIEPASYIPPHKHAKPPKAELMIAIRGMMALVTFDDQGELAETIRFGSNSVGSDLPVVVEVPPDTWHTIIGLETGAILLEVKAGPFDPMQPKELARWAPAEGGPEAAAYLEELRARMLENT